MQNTKISFRFETWAIDAIINLISTLDMQKPSMEEVLAITSDLELQRNINRKSPDGDILVLVLTPYDALTFLSFLIELDSKCFTSVPASIVFAIEGYDKKVRSVLTHGHIQEAFAERARRKSQKQSSNQI